MKVRHLATGILLAVSTSAMAADPVAVVDRSISEKDVVAAQTGWCDALVDIGKTYSKDGHAAAKALAGDIIDAAYGYQMGAVLFKPTLTVNPQTFRTTTEGALSYFVGGDQAFPNDDGFALKGWVKCEPENAAIFIAGNSATSMGKVHFTNKDGSVTTVDKTWGYVKDDAGALRIVLHHSSLEFQAD